MLNEILSSASFSEFLGFPLDLLLSTSTVRNLVKLIGRLRSQENGMVYGHVNFELQVQTRINILLPQYFKSLRILIYLILTRTQFILKLYQIQTQTSKKLQSNNHKLSNY